jgi:hypothetical protein
MVFMEASGGLTAGFGTVAYALLLLTPGAWITCGLKLGDIPFWARICTAAVLSPLVVCVEFYAIRLAGVPFAGTALLLLILNLPALYLVWIRRESLKSVDRTGLLVGAALIILPAACLAGLLVRPDSRVHAPHGWIHEDPAYMLARGDLALEDPTLAGIRLSYPPWGPLVLPAVQGFLVASPPVVSYIWSDLIWLVVFCSFGAGVAREMGGGWLARISSAIFLVVGMNPVGQIVTQWWPCCDVRDIQSFTKFELFGPMALALAMLMAMIYFVTRSGPLSTGTLAVTFLLLAGIGLLYPLLFPPGCCVIGARAMVPVLDGRSVEWPVVRKEWLLWTALVLVAGALTYDEIRFLTLDRHTADSAVSFSGKGVAARKFRDALIVTSLFISGWAFTVRRCWQSRRSATAILSVAAAASYVLYAMIHIPFYNNEYKFVFPAAMCLTVFPGIAMERVWNEWPRRWSVLALAAISILVLGTYGRFVWSTWPAPWALPRPASARPFERVPVLDTSGYYLRLDRTEPRSGLCDAVFQMTPPDAVLVVDDGTLYYPGLTSRSLYVSMPNRLYSGINVLSDDLDADIRGYGREVLARRRATLTELYGGADCRRQREALDTVLALNRPVALITESRHVKLVELLESLKTADELYSKDGLTLWQVHGPRTGAR